jgi:hypothetical protein
MSRRRVGTSVVYRRKMLRSLLNLSPLTTAQHTCRETVYLSYHAAAPLHVHVSMGDVPGEPLMGMLRLLRARRLERCRYAFFPIEVDSNPVRLFHP